ncbi:MAG: adenylate/guanylate cyclase domain-containing protein [Planctomycetota bacterium]
MTSEDRPLQETEELKIVYDIDRICDDTLDLDLLLRRLLVKVMDILSADQGAFVLRDDDTGELRVAEREGIPDPEPFFQENQAWITQALNAQGKEGAQVGETGRLFCKISMGDAAVGVLCIVRSSGRAFSARDRSALSAVEGQIDNAIEHAKVLRRLQLRNKELEILYRIDRIRDSTENLQDMLDQILVELQAALDAEMGFIMLYNDQLKKLELKAMDDKGSGVLLRAERDLIDRVSDMAVAAARPMIWKPDDRGKTPAHEVLCAPLFLRDNLIGVFGVLNKKTGRAFDADDKRLLTAIISQADTAIFEDARKALLTKLFKRFVSPQVADALLRDPYKPYLEGEAKEITALFCDLRGYSTTVADMDPKDVVAFLNEFLSEMSALVLANDGTLDKFIGDEVVALFGAPIPFEDHALRACRAALRMQEKLHDLNRSWASRGLPTFGMGIGLNSGPVVVGNIGGEVYLDYTAIGANMNLASRLQGIAKANQILLGPNTYAQVRHLADVEDIGDVTVKGHAKPLRIHHLRGLH